MDDDAELENNDYKLMQLINKYQVTVKPINTVQQLKQISALHFFYQKIEVAEAKIIAESINLVNLTYLNLSSSNIGDAGLKVIAESMNLVNLTYLNLSSSNIGDAGVKTIIESTCLSNLQALDLGRNNIGDVGAEVIANSVYSTNLTELNLSNNQIKNAGSIVLGNIHQASKYLWLSIYEDDIYNNKIRQLNSQHQEAYSKLINGIKLVLRQLDIESNNINIDNEYHNTIALIRIQEACKIPCGIINLLCNEASTIKQMFARPTVFNNFFAKNNLMFAGKINTVAQLLQKLHIHKNKYLFTITQVFKNSRPQDKIGLDNKFIIDNDSQTTITKTTISSLPAEIITYIASFLLPIDIKLVPAQMSLTTLVNSTTSAAVSEPMSANDHSIAEINVKIDMQLNTIGDVA